MPYEELATQANFSESEETFQMNRLNIKLKKPKKALLKAKFLKKQLDEFKKLSIQGMLAIVDTISLIDESS